MTIEETFINKLTWLDREVVNKGEIQLGFHALIKMLGALPWEPVQSASYVVWSDGLTPPTYYAKNGTTGQIVFSGTSFSTVAQAVISLGGKIVFKGTFTKTTIPGLLVPSGTEIEIPAGSTITFGNNVGDGAAIFNLSSVSQVTVWGAGTLDGNLVGQAGGNQNAVVMTGATQCRVDVYMQNFRGRPVLDDGYNVATNRYYPNAITSLPDFNGLMAGHPNVHVVEPIENDGTWTFIAPGGTAIAWSNDVVYTGTQSLKFTVVAANLARISAATLWAGTPLDLTKKSIGVWINYDSLAQDPTKDTVIRYLIYAPDASNYFSCTAANRHMNNRPNEWQYIGVCPQGYYYTKVGNPDITNAQGIIINVYTTSETYNVYVDTLTIVDNMFPNGAVILSFDGPYTSQFENAFPIMQERDLKGVLWAVTDWVGDPIYDAMTLDQLKILQQAGWDVASHASEMLDLSTAPLGEVERVVAKAKDWLVSNGFPAGARFFSLPFGTTVPLAEEIIKDYHILSRTITMADNLPGLPLFEPFTMQTLPGKGTLATAKLEIDNLALTGGLGIYYWHNIQTPKQAGELTIAEYEELMDYIVASGVQVITLSDIVDKYLVTYPTPPKTPKQDFFLDVLAANATHVRSNEDLSVGTPITFTIDAQPDVPRTITATFDSHAQITAYTITITGVDARGRTISETKTAGNGWTWETNNAFLHIDGIIMSSRTGTGAGDTMDIGIGETIGLSNQITDTGDVYKIKKNNADAVVAAAQVDTQRSTYDLSVIGIGGGDDFTFWYNAKP